MAWVQGSAGNWNGTLPRLVHRDSDHGLIRGELRALRVAPRQVPRLLDDDLRWGWGWRRGRRALPMLDVSSGMPQRKHEGLPIQLRAETCHCECGARASSWVLDAAKNACGVRIGAVAECGRCEAART